MTGTNQTQQPIRVSTIYMIKPVGNLRPDTPVYIGSTTKSLKKRMDYHNYNFKYYLNGKQGWTTSFRILSLQNFEIISLARIPNVSNRILHSMEHAFIRMYPSAVNLYKPGNTDKCMLYDRNVKQFCGCGGSYSSNNKSTHFKTRKHQRWLNPQESKSNSSDTSESSSE